MKLNILKIKIEFIPNQNYDLEFGVNDLISNFNKSVDLNFKLKF